MRHSVAGVNMYGRIIDRLTKKDWSDDDVQRFVGSIRSAYLSHARDPEVRAIAASGGTTSAVLIDGLVQGYFQGAIVCRAVLVCGQVRPEFSVATSGEEILAARGSKYVETRFLHDVLPLIRAFDGKVAVVGLPCDIAALRHRCSKEPGLARKVVLTIALVCGHNSRTGLIDAVTKRIERKAGQRLKGYRFRVGHWRGHLEAELEDGSIVSMPTKVFNDYQNLFLFCERKCLACYDHYGYAADITMGDVWLFRLKRDPIKHTGVITRTEAGQQVFDAAVRTGSVAASAIDVRDIMDGQARIGPSHYNVSARAKAGKRMGIKLPDPVGVRVSWHAYVNALMTLSAVRLSELGWGRRLIWMTPRPILKGLLYVKKGLESLK